MPTYLVTYKFGHSGAFGQRLDDFMSRLQATEWWGETASTMVVYTEEPLDEFCGRILAPSCFDKQRDVAVVFDLDSREGRAHGYFRDTGLFNIAPWVRRL